MPPLLRVPLRTRSPFTTVPLHWTKSSVRCISDGRLRLSNIWVPALGEDFKDSPHIDQNAQDGNTHLLRAGYVRQSHSGLFHFLPLGQRVLEKLERQLDTHMTFGLGASKVALSSISAVDLWRQSGRLEGSLRSPGHEFFAVRDRPGEEEEKFLLAPTCEEEITAMAKTRIAWGDALPLRLYQIERKYRNEMRPRKGLLRSKEFVMKDLYTFDMDKEEALKTYQLVRDIYDAFFESLGVPFLVAIADSGNMGGNLSHEYHYISDLGEDIVWTCSSCKFIANDEVIPHNESNNSGHSCPKCTSGTLIPHRTIEVGHTFFLGDRYTSKFDCRVNPNRSTPKGSQKAEPAYAQMGCFGIGVSRLIGALAAVCQQPADDSNQVRLRWPPKIAPFDVVVISNRKKHPQEIMTVYDQLVQRAGGTLDVDAVLDDRPGKSLMFKLKDAEMHGIPVACVVGEAWDRDGHIEVRTSDKEDAKVEFVPLDQVRQTVEKLLEPEMEEI